MPSKLSKRTFSVLQKDQASRCPAWKSGQASHRMLPKNTSHAGGNLITCTVGEDKFREIIPSERRGQVLHQAIVLQVQYVVQVATSETGILYTAVVFVPSTVSNVCVKALRMAVEESVEWVHQAQDPLPSFTDVDTYRVVRVNIPFWKMVNTQVHRISPFPPPRFLNIEHSLCNTKPKEGWTALRRDLSSVIRS